VSWRPSAPPSARSGLPSTSKTWLATTAALPCGVWVGLFGHRQNQVSAQSRGPFVLGPMSTSLLRPPDAVAGSACLTPVDTRCERLACIHHTRDILQTPAHTHLEGFVVVAAGVASTPTSQAHPDLSWPLHNTRNHLGSPACFLRVRQPGTPLWHRWQGTGLKEHAPQLLQACPQEATSVILSGHVSLGDERRPSSRATHPSPWAWGESQVPLVRPPPRVSHPHLTSYPTRPP